MKTNLRERKNAALAAELMEAGVVLMRQNLRRRFPGASAQYIEESLRAWLCRDDDPIPGDVSGKVRVRERGV